MTISAAAAGKERLASRAVVGVAFWILGVCKLALWERRRPRSSAPEKARPRGRTWRRCRYCLLLDRGVKCSKGWSRRERLVARRRRPSWYLALSSSGEKRILGCSRTRRCWDVPRVSSPGWGWGGLKWGWGGK